MSVTLPDVKLREIISGWRSSFKPIGEFLNKSNHDLPTNYRVATRRFFKNIDYFHSNYLCVVIITLIIQILVSPMLLFVIVTSAALSILILRLNVDRKIKIIGYEAILTTTRQLKVLAITSILAFWIVGGTFSIGWVACFSVIFITGHAVTHNTEKEGQQQVIVQEV